MTEKWGRKSEILEDKCQKSNNSVICVLSSVIHLLSSTRYALCPEPISPQLATHIPQLTTRNSKSYLIRDTLPRFHFARALPYITGDQ